MNIVAHIFSMFFFQLYFQNKRFTCKTCKATRGSLLQIQKHMKAHNKGTIIKCRICRKPFDDSNHCEEHEDSHVLEARYTCVIIVNKESGAICNKRYCLKGSVRTHVQSVHKLKLEVRTYNKDENVTYELYDDIVKRTSKKPIVRSNTHNICDAAQVWGGPRTTEHTKECLLPRRPGC